MQPNQKLLGIILMSAADARVQLVSFLSRPLHKSVCCRHTQLSGSQWLCPWTCPLQGGVMYLIFVDAGVKINDAILPWGVSDSKAIACHACDLWSYFCSSKAVLLHRAHETVNLLRWEMPAVISNTNTNTTVISIAPPTVWPMAHYRSQLTRVSQP